MAKLHDVTQYLRRHHRQHRHRAEERRTGTHPKPVDGDLYAFGGIVHQGTLATLVSNNTAWPPASPAGTNAIGQPITIAAKYPFRSVIAMFWPGLRRRVGPGLVYFPASSTDRIQF